MEVKKIDNIDLYKAVDFFVSKVHNQGIVVVVMDNFDITINQVYSGFETIEETEEFETGEYKRVYEDGVLIPL
jgi:hypothetical protein